MVYGLMPFEGSNYKTLVRLISEAKYCEPKVKSGKRIDKCKIFTFCEVKTSETH